MLLILLAASLSCNALVPSAEVTLEPTEDQSPPSALEKPTATEQSADIPSIEPTEDKSQPVLPATEDVTNPNQPGSVLFFDDFEDPSSGWEIGDYDMGSVGYANGSYFVESIAKDNLMWGLAGKVFEDTDITVEASQITAPSNDNNGYGVMCRVQSNDDGYILRISGDGYAAIQYFEGGELFQIVEWFESPLINLGNATNTIRVVCDGPELILFVNGAEAARATHTKFTRGDIALTATSYEEEPTRVLYDNIRVSVPDTP